MLQNIKRKFTYQLVVGLFIFLSIWWVILYFSGSTKGFPNYLYGAVYGPSMTAIGVVFGLRASKYWGGMHSLMGKTIIALSLGLFAEFFGQVVFSYYNIFLHIDIPYPSFADIGFFGNIPLYFFGAVLLLRISGGNISLRTIQSQIIAILIPVCMLTISYFLFLQSYKFDWSQPLKIVLDFGYPLGQALYVSVAILTFGLSKKFLGGIMRVPIFILIIAFATQYLADFNFLFQNNNGTWYNGGYGDYLYLIAYSIMTLGLLELGKNSMKTKFEG